MSLVAGYLLNVSASLTPESPRQAPKQLCQNLLLFHVSAEQQLWVLTPVFTKSPFPWHYFCLVIAAILPFPPPNKDPNATSVTHLVAFWGWASNRHSEPLAGTEGSKSCCTWFLFLCKQRNATSQDTFFVAILDLDGFPFYWKHGWHMQGLIVSCVWHG